MNLMSKGVFIKDKKYTFSESMHFLAQALSLIGDKSEGLTFSIADVLCLLRNVNEYVPGEFEIQHTYSHYYQIIYKSEDEVTESFKQRWEGFNE